MAGTNVRPSGRNFSEVSSFTMLLAVIYFVYNRTLLKDGAKLGPRPKLSWTDSQYHIETKAQMDST
jgi:hypothetical protein